MHIGIRVALAALMFAVVAVQDARAGHAKKYANWKEIAVEMCEILDDSGKIYETGAIEKAKARVNDAYFGLYEKMGFERNVMSYISGKRVAAVEYKFSYVRKRMTSKAANEEIREELALLKKMLTEDAHMLDGTASADEAPEENEGFVMPDDELLKKFEEEISPEGLSPEEFEERKIEFLKKQGYIKEKK